MVSGRAKVYEKTVRALVGSVNDFWELDGVEMGELACSGGALFGRKICLRSSWAGGISVDDFEVDIE